MFYVRLEFENGDFLLKMKSDVSAPRHAIARAYHIELQKQLAGIAVWSPEDCARALYNYFGLYYQKVVEALGWGFDCDSLTDESRHLLLVCTEPNNGIPGLSYLEQLMGYSVEEKRSQASAENKNFPTTGSDVLDIKTDLFLVFKTRAQRLWESHSLEECALMCRQANERMKDPEDKDDSEWNEEDKGIRDEIFIQKREIIINRLNELGVNLPKGF